MTPLLWLALGVVLGAGLATVAWCVWFGAKIAKIVVAPKPQIIDRRYAVIRWENGQPILCDARDARGGRVTVGEP